MAEKFGAFGDRYDDRFVCRWHYYPPDDAHPAGHMGWCGVDCHTQRYRVGMKILHDLASEGRIPDPAYRAADQWDRLREWAVSQQPKTA